MIRVLFYLLLPCLIAGAVISSANTGNESSGTAGKVDAAKWTTATKYVDDCLNREYAAMVKCFGVKAIAVLERASRMKSLNLMPGVTFVADAEELERSGRALMSEEQIENSVATTDSNDGASKLLDMLFDSASRFFQSHSLQLRIPETITTAELQSALDEEGRAKIKKKWLPVLGLVAVKLFSLLPLFFGAIGFLALKALIVGKIALVIAGILALQKYSSTGSFPGFGKLTAPEPFGSSASSYSPISSAGGYYRRSIDDSSNAQNLAYSARIP